MDYFPYAFSGPIEQNQLGTIRYTVMWLPDRLAAELPFNGQARLRISGELNEAPVTGAWQPCRGRWYLMLGKALLRTTGLAIGDVAELRFRSEPFDAVEAPSFLLKAIALSRAQAPWQDLPPGKQRAIAHFLASAKRSATLTRRVAQVIAWLESGERDLRSLPRMEV